MNTNDCEGRQGIPVHCWHVVSSTTDGMAERGYDYEVCCWCDRRRKNHWRVVPHHSHGPHVNMQEQQRNVAYDYEAKR